LNKKLRKLLFFKDFSIVFCSAWDWWSHQPATSALREGPWSTSSVAVRRHWVKGALPVAPRPSPEDYSEYHQLWNWPLQAPLPIEEHFFRLGWGEAMISCQGSLIWPASNSTRLGVES